MDAITTSVNYIVTNMPHWVRITGTPCDETLGTFHKVRSRDVCVVAGDGIVWHTRHGTCPPLTRYTGSVLCCAVLCCAVLCHLVVWDVWAVALVDRGRLARLELPQAFPGHGARPFASTGGVCSRLKRGIAWQAMRRDTSSRSNCWSCCSYHQLLGVVLSPLSFVACTAPDSQCAVGSQQHAGAMDDAAAGLARSVAPTDSRSPAMQLHYYSSHSTCGRLPFPCRRIPGAEHGAESPPICVFTSSIVELGSTSSVNVCRSAHAWRSA